MTWILRLCAVCVFAAATTADAQEPAPVAIVTMPDSTAVTDVAIKSGKLMLASLANPKPTALPDATYKNEINTIIVILDGRIARIQPEQNETTEVASVHLSRRGIVVLTPSTNALMAVTGFALPDGSFKSEDGSASFTVVNGRPYSFTLPAAPEKH